MNLVTHYIKQTLFSHNCVIIPGFGGFLSDYKSANINPISGEFAPPEVEISFNSSLHKDDGLLKSEISRGEEIEIQEAENIIEQFVQEITQRLDEHLSFNINGLGVFDLNEDKIVYTPQELENLNSDTFGLPNFKIHAIERNTEDMKRVRPVPPARRVVKRKAAKVSSEIKESAAGVVTSASEKIVSSSKPKKKEEEKKEESNKRSRYALIPVILLLIAGGVTGYIFYKKNNAGDSVLASNEKAEGLDTKTNNAGLVSTSDSGLEEEIDKTIDGASSLVNGETNSSSSSSSETEGTSSLSNATGSNGSESNNSSSESLSNNNSSSSSVSNIGSGYNIVIGSFAIPSNAQKVMNRTSGSAIVTYNGLNCVSVGTYSTRAEALNALSSYSNEHPGAWVANIR